MRLKAKQAPCSLRLLSACSTEILLPTLPAQLPGLCELGIAAQLCAWAGRKVPDDFLEMLMQKLWSELNSFPFSLG